MAIKKTAPVKTARPSGVKKAAGKIAEKKILVKKTAAAEKPAAEVKKTAVKKTPAKKALVKKKAAKKPAAPEKTAAVKKAASPKKPAASAKVKSADLKISKKEKTEKQIIKNAAQLLVDAAVEGILEVKGRNISILDLKDVYNRVCDYYIICQADSNTQVNAIAGSVEVMVKKRIGERPYHTEGFQNSEWVLVDYVTVVVHVFQSQIREFYNLEALWADAEVTKIAFD